MSTFCLRQIVARAEKLNIMQACDSAFEKSIIKRDDFDTLFEKINHHAYFLAASCDKTIGYAAVYVNDEKNKTAYLTLIGILMEYRKTGAGKRLLLECEEVARKNGMNILKLECRKNNKNALGFYEHMGFQYFCDATEKTIYMTKKL